jgi:hypothetical protein
VTTLDDKSGSNVPGPGGDGAASPDEARFVERVRGVLLDSADALDGRTRSRLTQARHAALEQLKSGAVRPALPQGRWLAPVASLAAVAMVALVWVEATRTVDPLPQSAGVNTPAASPPLDDIAIMADAESLELLEEIEFYAWLDTDANLPPVAGGGVG